MVIGKALLPSSYRTREVKECANQLGLHGDSRRLYRGPIPAASSLRPMLEGAVLYGPHRASSGMLVSYLQTILVHPITRGICDHPYRAKFRRAKRVFVEKSRKILKVRRKQIYRLLSDAWRKVVRSRKMEDIRS